jgi:hypothetical protein
MASFFKPYTCPYFGYSKRVGGFTIVLRGYVIMINDGKVRITVAVKGYLIWNCKGNANQEEES